MDFENPEFGKKKVGKVGTRGAQQIAKENVETITFYRNMILGANGIYFLIMTILGATYQSTEISMFLLVLLIYVGCFQFLFRCGTPKTSEPDGKGQLIDPGLDLNMASGLAEHVKDAIILTAIAQILSLLSNYFWLALSFAPLRLFWMAWKSIIAPWLFAPAPEKEEIDEKKQKKLDRKMKRGRWPVSINWLFIIQYKTDKIVNRDKH